MWVRRAGGNMENVQMENSTDSIAEASKREEECDFRATYVFVVVRVH